MDLVNTVRWERRSGWELTVEIEELGSQGKNIVLFEKVQDFKEF